MTNKTNYFKEFRNMAVKAYESSMDELKKAKGPELTSGFLSMAATAEMFCKFTDMQENAHIDLLKAMPCSCKQPSLDSGFFQMSTEVVKCEKHKQLEMFDE